MRDLLFTTVEPAVESALKGFKLSPFKFDRDRVFLGQVPPRITGIKVLALTCIVMDFGLRLENRMLDCHFPRFMTRTQVGRRSFLMLILYLRVISKLFSRLKVRKRDSSTKAS